MSHTASGDCVGAIVADIGSLYSRVGFAGDEGPGYMGLSFADRDGRLVDFTHDGPARHPFRDERGCLRVDMTLLEGLLRQTVTGALSTELQDRPLLISEPYDADKTTRMSTIDVAFEVLGCSASYIARKPPLALMSVGRGNGLVTHMSHGQCVVAPVLDGFVLEKNQQVFSVGGAACDEELAKGLGLSTDSFASRLQLTQARESVGRVVPMSKTADLQTLCEASADNAAAAQYEFPDGTILKATDLVAVQSTEKLFTSDVSFGGIVASAASVVMQSDPDIRRSLLQGAAFVGGLTLTRGLSERLVQEVAADASIGCQKYKLIAPSGTHERRFASWIGGSILGSLSTFGQMWVTREEFDEVGSSIVIRKCL